MNLKSSDACARGVVQSMSTKAKCRNTSFDGSWQETKHLSHAMTTVPNRRHPKD
jgi:hypothetical protein